MRTERSIEIDPHRPERAANDADLAARDADASARIALRRVVSALNAGADLDAIGSAARYAQVADDAAASAVAKAREATRAAVSGDPIAERLATESQGFAAIARQAADSAVEATPAAGDRTG